VCDAGACTCAPGYTQCGNACVVTDNDPNHCGACGNACAPGDVCMNGNCAQDCGGLDQCGQSCVDFKNDPQNCGECGKQCKADQICVDGGCEDFFVPNCNSCPCNECQGDFDQCCFNDFVGHTVCAKECP